MELFERMMEKMNKERIENSKNLTLGALLEKLSNFEDYKEVILSTGDFLKNSYDSYRGYYEDISIEPSTENEDNMTVGKLEELVNRALSDGTMYGYKGGDFDIESSTLVWVAFYGCTGQMLVDLQEIDGKVVAITKYEEA